MAVSGHTDIHKYRIKVKKESPYFAMMTKSSADNMTSKDKGGQKNGEQRGQELAK